MACGAKTQLRGAKTHFDMQSYAVHLRIRIYKVMSSGCESKRSDFSRNFTAATTVISTEEVGGELVLQSTEQH